MTDQAPNTPETKPQAPGPRRRVTVVGALAVAAALGLAVLYGTNRGWGNAGDADCAPARSVADAMAPLAKGEVAAVQVNKAPNLQPTLA